MNPFGALKLRTLDGDYAPGTVIPAEERSNPSIKILPGTTVPAVFRMVADITGQFANAKTGIVTKGKVTANEVSDLCLIKGETYHIELIVQLQQAIYGWRLSNKTQAEPAMLVRVNKPTKLVHFSADVEAATLWGDGPRWNIETVATPLQISKVANRVTVQNQVSYRGTINGNFLHFTGRGKDATENTRLMDALGLKEYGFVGGNYTLSSLFTDLRPASHLYGIAFGGISGENLMRVDVDSPQKAMVVRGLIEGKKFAPLGLRFGTTDESIIVGDKQ